jgi:hypothetical protein
MNNLYQAETAPLEDVVTVLRNQLVSCAALADECFTQAQKENLFFASRSEAMKIGARLIQSCTGIAIALKRLEGAPQSIVVTHTPPMA